MPARKPISSDAWQKDEAVLLRFEEAWKKSYRPELADFLPGNTANPTLLAELVHIDLEMRLKAGEQARVEEYLVRFPRLRENREHLLELIAGEFVQRRRREPDLGLEEFHERFPDHAESLPCFLPALSVTQPDNKRVDNARQSKVTTVTPADRPEPRATWPNIVGYEVLGELGRGGMGVVYKARQLGFGRLVALKMILAGGNADSNERRRFRSEAEAVARLRHPNIIQVYDVGEVAGNPYFSLEYCEGGSLASRLNGMPLPLREAAQIVETLAKAMQAAHDEGIIHRDLKPANVLLVGDDERRMSGVPCTSSSADHSLFAHHSPKIADFGLAKRLDAPGHTASNDIMGTPSYMAPEQATGKVKEVGAAADIYALGAILYELLTGRPPFKAATPLKTILQVTIAEPVPPTRLNGKVPRDLETVCLKCLHKEPGKRYGSARELGDDLGRFLAHMPVKARPVSRAERLWRWCRRNPAVAGLLAVATVLMMFVGSLGIDTVGQRWQRAAAVATLLADANELLDRARLGGLEDSESLAKAQSKLDEAKAILGSGALSATLAEHEQDLRRQVMDETKGRSLIAQLEEIKGQVLFQDGVALPTYGDVFRNGLGIEAKQLAAGQAGELIREKIKSPGDFWLVAALDAWLFVSRKGPGVEKWLAEVLEVADTDVWRARARRAWVSRDRHELERLAVAADVFDQPPVTLITIAEALLGHSPKMAATLLRRAQQQYPANVWLNFELGVALERCQPPERREAVGYYTAAVALAPRDAVLLTGLGKCLKELGRAEEAIAAFRKAVKLNPKFVPARQSLAEVLRLNGQFREALDLLQDLPRNSPLVPRARVAELKRLVELEKKLPELLAGRYQPKKEDWTGLFEICFRDQHYHAAYKQLHSALANGGKPATDLKARYRSLAAAAAVLAACGQGKDAKKLDNAVRGTLRHKAMRLLEQEMAVCRRQLASGDRAAIKDIQETLARWEADEALAGVREPAEIAKLPTAQQRAWREFWRKVDLLHAEAQSQSKRWLKAK